MRPEDVSLSGCLSTSGGIESVACFVSRDRMFTEYSVPRLTSATELWRVKAIARQHSGTAERPGSDLPFGAGQQSWLAHGREKQTSRKPENCSNNTPSKMYVKYLKIKPQLPSYSDNDLQARGISTHGPDLGRQGSGIYLRAQISAARTRGSFVLALRVVRRIDTSPKPTARNSSRRGTPSFAPVCGSKGNPR